MSFLFYNRLSSKSTRTRDLKETGNKHASASFATGAFNQSDPPRTSHTRNSSKMRIIPFLGKRRKSLATLRPSAVAEDDDSMLGGLGHYKTVSQLANETAARLARTSLGAAGSLSTGNLELSSFDASQLKLDLGSAYATPTRARQLDARHTMFPSGSTKNSTPDKASIWQSKRSSERPTKTSFLSRISSRPSLASRYSSADLKSNSKTRTFFKPLERHQVFSVAPQRKEIIHPMNMRGLGDDNDFFASPRVAPTPPNLSFASPDSSLLESPLGPSRSTVTLPSQRQSPLSYKAGSYRSHVLGSSINADSLQPAAKYSSSPTTIKSHISLSPEMALRSPRRYSVSGHNPATSPGAMKDAITANTAAGTPIARPRASHVRIGTEKVTISVANVLEAELGVEVDDSEESSYYDDIYEENRRFGNEVVRPGQNHVSRKAPGDNSSDLPALSPNSDDFDLAFKFPKIKERTESDFTLESESPLSVLMSASSGEKTCSPTGVSTSRLRHAAINEAAEEKTSETHIIDRTQVRSNHQSNSGYLQSLGSQARDVDRLDRISERSVPLCQESPRDVEEKKRTIVANTEDNSEIVSQLQRALDVQCARFDRLSGHLLQIIQRHQNEKVQLESQIATLEKEGRRSEREINALRKLIARTNNRSSREGRNSRRLVRVASMQSFLSNLSMKDEEVDMFAAMEMVARAGRRKARLSPDISKESRASFDLSPGQTPTKNMDLRRSKTMPDLHKAATAGLTPMPSPPPQETSPDVSGLGLGLDFPLPEPLKLPSFASAIMSTQESAASIPPLTAAPTAASGISLATEASVDSCAALIASPPGHKSAGVGRGAARSAREKRMAGEWRPGGIQGLYRPLDQLPQPSAPPTCEVPALPASASYAKNLNKLLATSPIDHAMKQESPDLDEIFKKLVSSSSGLRG